MPTTPKQIKGNHRPVPYPKIEPDSSPPLSASPSPDFMSANIFSSTDQKPDINTTPKSKGKGKNASVKKESPKDKGGARGKPAGSGRPWTADEKRQLLHFALERNGRGWDQAVPGRTASQASQTWKVTVLPYLERALG